MRTSLPWCFGSARPSFERSFAGSAGRRANGRSETSFLGSSESNVWQYGLLAAGPICTSLPWCFGSARPSYHTAFRLRWPSSVQGSAAVGVAFNMCVCMCLCLCVCYMLYPSPSLHRHLIMYACTWIYTQYQIDTCFPFPTFFQTLLLSPQGVLTILNKTYCVMMYPLYSDLENAVKLPLLHQVRLNKAYPSWQE